MTILRKNILMPVAVGIMFLANGCKDDLSITPTDVIDASKAYTTTAELQGGLIGAYGGTGNADINLSNYLSDESYYPIENGTGRGAIQYRWQYDSSDGTISANWYNLYTVIDRVNRVLAAAQNINDDPTLKTKVRGELLALRAYAHFQILKSYASTYDAGGLGIPYMEKSEIGKPARLNVGQVFAKIEADLTAAKALIPATANDNTRITLRAVSAIQARVFLYQKKWDQAITAATEAITGSPLATIAQFPGIWTDANNNEVIWKLKRVNGDGRMGDLFASTAGVVEFAAAPKLINTYNQLTDVRFNSYIKIDNGRGTNKTPNLIVKYYGGQATLKNLADIKLFRTSEMYLIRAEAYAEKENYQLAADDVNAIRSNRITGYVNIGAYADKATAVADIYLERYKELAWEGHRYFDLRRRGMTISRTPLAADDNSQGAVTLTPTTKQYILPVSSTEIFANPNIQQNPNY